MSSNATSGGGVRRRYLIALVAAALVLAALLRPFPGQFKFRYGGDCVRYLTWSRVVATEGVRAFPKLVDEYRHRWLGFPPPTRWTYLLGIAATMRLWPAPGDEYHPLVLWSWLPSVLALLPLALWLRRAVSPLLLGVALLLCATSPMARALGHFPLPDALQLLLGLSLFALTSAWLGRPRPWLLAAMAAMTFWTVTSREPSLILVLAAGALVLLDAKDSGARLRDARWQPLAALLAGCVLAALATVPVAGGFGLLAALVRDYVWGNMHTGNSGLVGGPHYRYAVDFMILSPLLTVTTIAFLPTAWRDERWRPILRQVIVAGAVVFALFSPLNKDLRYLLPVDASMRVIAAAAVVWLWSAERRLWAAALALGLVGNDVYAWHHLWSGDQIYTPVTMLLARGLGMIP